jgi:hypothetical protein
LQVGDVQGSAASPEARQRASLPSVSHLVNVELRLSERPSDCADIFGLVVPAQLGFLREVGTIFRSAQSAIPHALVSDFVPLREQHFADEQPSTAYLSAQ